jgi:hypothetical protein
MKVLWEQGWINEGHIEKCTLDVATDNDGEIVEGAENCWSLKYLKMASSCLDLGEEMTALQATRWTRTWCLCTCHSKVASMPNWPAKEFNVVGECPRACTIECPWMRKGHNIFQQEGISS